MVKYVKTEQGYVDASIFAPAQFKPEGKSYLTFSSPNNFTLEVNNRTKNWDGILEYFAYDKTWTVWDGTTILSGHNNDGEYVLYLRGTGNTKITGMGTNINWIITGTDIKCIGNIENLLDYATVASGKHPTMAKFCYSQMFYGCASLTQAPALPATTLANYCYSQMFSGCTSLTQAPELPATTLAKSCYFSMFSNCTALTQAPTLPATTLEANCYNNMFYGCTSLTQAPALPATTLTEGCYGGMFSGCTALTQAPALPATTLENACYRSMFQGCTSLKLSSTKTGEYTQEYRIPSSGTGTIHGYALTDMFVSTGGTFTGTPAINTTYYLSTDNMIVRDTEVATLNGYVGSMIDNSVSNPLNITGATVGQIAKITAVDESGKPTSWEAVDGGVQSDWNQNDETAADYVKNRPFYTGNPVETVLVEERTVSFAEYSGLYMAELTSTFEATVGETYKVYWDGAAYECNCVDFQHMPAIGNLSIVGAGSDTGEPFIMAISNGEGIAIRTADTSASHTFSISGFGTEIVKIDAKYLPDTIATKSEVEAAQTTANAAQTTANAAQTTAENAQSTANAAQTTANAALPKTGGTMSGNLTIDTENDSFQTIISPGGMALQYVPSAGDVNDELVISGWGTPRIVAREGSDSGFKLSDMGLSLGCTSTTKDGIHLRHSNGSSSPGEIVIQHTNLNNHAKERISIASTGEIECNNRLKFNCGSEIEVVQPLGKTGGSAIILHSSTPNSTKKFKINVDDSGVPTITDKSDSTNTWKPTNLPTVTSSDSGKFLRVSDTGEWAAETILSAYEKPDTGIPKSDLEQSVQTSLAKADTSISYDSQTLTEAQQKQARDNIGAGQPVFAVNVTGVGGSGGYTADKTAAEIEAAYQAGRTIVCKTQAQFIIGYIPVELPLVSRNQARVFIFSADQLMGENAIFTITVNISDSGVEVSTKGVEIYEKPTSGIPKSDLADDVQTSLAKADTAISLGLTAATPGQIIKVKTVQDGKPTEWEAVDMDAGKFPKFQKLLTHTITEDELAASPIAFMWGTAQIPNLNDFNVFVLTIVRPDGAKIEFSKWVKLKINNTLFGNICGTSTAASPQYTITANRLFGVWISGNYYDPRNIGVPVLVPPRSSSTYHSDLPDSEPVTSIGFTSYVADYGLTAGIVVEIWGAK